MNFVLIAIFAFFVFGVLALFTGNQKSIMADLIRTCGPIGGSILGLIPVIQVLAGKKISAFIMPWELFNGSFYLEIDLLSAFFLLPIFILTILASFYGFSYLKQYANQRNLGSIAFFFNLFIMSMVLVVCAKNIIMFLLAWELMALTSFFLVMFESEKSLTKWTGWLYMSLTHLGTACLFVFFFMAADGALSFDFGDIAISFDKNKTSLCFLLALIGFGTKAGMIPFHIWLPEAHPAAPAHVSAIMSGVMIKTGIYGILRTILLIGVPGLSWGIVLIILGALSGVIGILFALAQHDIKRLLAYSSVENIGIILLGLGLGVVGIKTQSPVMGVLGLAGAFLHILNHAFFKGLLFFGAGSVIYATHTNRIDELGGILKRMPLTGLTFFIGSISICGLPPFNGFISELFIYMGSFKEIVVGDFDNTSILLPIITILALVTIGGLAALCFTKAFSIIFLGEPRYKFNHEIKESPAFIVYPMLVLCAICVMVGVFPSLILPILEEPVSLFFSNEVVRSTFVPMGEMFGIMTYVYLSLIGFITLIAIVRNMLVKRRSYQTTVTWDCGYIRPQATMQYTASSFVETLVDIFSFILRTKKTMDKPSTYFPLKNAGLNTRTADTFAQKLYYPVYYFFKGHMFKLLKIQYGNINLYMFYIILTLVIMLSVNLLTRSEL
ncbi:MAG: hypothetical protein A2381_02165 [Bdellovibrionales bacterium RIFOXYB1_FULL_37_110]|nr:MAG: hypothetical protein A2417_13470 [Bdellovibrionales bacterium RIFOXYC1_FULL_37_79]OFZ59244.1 MAG: hypothetical protein A2381_02165 [Bdellovibrionales bacterium RIFOXYB1_FULL_37_110]OFZ62870.1 MAG: hypothetical protein A2577_11120 [Bdellovibrionales bacterium RIFOXYD1_FULL_36_51]